MLQNSNVIAFTVFELLRENQQRRGKITTAPSPPRLGLKYFLPKGNLLDTTILLISILFIEIGFLC